MVVLSTFKRAKIKERRKEEMRQTSEEFMNALLSEEVEDSTNPSNVNDMLAKMESTISEKIKEVESNVMNKLTENLSNVSRETLQDGADGTDDTDGTDGTDDTDDNNEE